MEEKLLITNILAGMVGKEELVAPALVAVVVAVVVTLSDRRHLWLAVNREGHMVFPAEHRASEGVEDKEMKPLMTAVVVAAAASAVVPAVPLEAMVEMAGLARVWSSSHGKERAKMKYIYLIDNKVHEIIPEIDPAFPDIPITDRYSADFLAHCVTADDDTTAEQGWQYIDGAFVKPITPEPEVPPETLPAYLEAAKASRIAQSKADLETYLAEHPLQWTDGEYYSITAEKQNQLTSKIMAATMAQTLSTDYTLTWNSTGEVCKEWTLQDLSALAFAIDARVTKLVSYQQAQEVAMRNAETLDELNAIEVDYDAVS